jgi:chitin disaccharide deacetylase
MNQAKPSLRRQLIINGDDFGFSTGVNQAIIAAHTQGILTSTSLMVTGAAFAEAVELAKAHPRLAVGLHLVLACGRSVLPPSQIPHLVDADQNFSNQPEQAGLYYHFSAAARRELPWEIRAQLTKFRATGLPLSHVDGHVHVHLQPVVMHHLARLAAEFKIQFVRLPGEDLTASLKADRSEWFTKVMLSLVYAGLRSYGAMVLRSHQIRFADRVYGLLQSGRMTEAYLLKLMPHIHANLVEIYAHPAVAIAGEPANEAYGLGEMERDALISDRVRDLIHRQGFELTNYSQLGAVAR